MNFAVIENQSELSEYAGSRGTPTPLFVTQRRGFDRIAVLFRRNLHRSHAIDVQPRLSEKFGLSRVCKIKCLRMLILQAYCSPNSCQCYSLLDGNEKANCHPSDSYLCPTKVSYNKHDGKKAKPARGHGEGPLSFP